MPPSAGYFATSHLLLSPAQLAGSPAPGSSTHSPQLAFDHNEGFQTHSSSGQHKEHCTITFGFPSGSSSALISPIMRGCRLLSIAPGERNKRAHPAGCFPSSFFGVCHPPGGGLLHLSRPARRG